jgi:hypothetical protein
MAKNKKWEDLVLESIANKMDPTYLGPSQPRVGMEDQPNFKVYEFSPNRKLDGEERDLVTGPEWSIMQQVSQIKVMHDLLGRRLGYNFTFENWFKDWQEGFKWGINRTGSDKSLKTNYPISDVTRGGATVPGWRADKSQRPAYLEWKNPNDKANPNYRVIEYFPNRSIDNDSIVLTGSDAQIIQQILQIEYEGGGTTTLDEEGFVGGWYGVRTGQPEILLSFWEDLEDVEVGYHRVKGRIRFRIMDKSDDPDSPLSPLTWNNIAHYQDKIFEQFQQPNGGTGFIWKKGKEKLTYTDRDRGYESRILCRSRETGLDVITRMLAVQNFIVDNKRWNYSEAGNPTEKHPIIPPTKTILGQPVKMPRTRPIADVRFSRAVLYLQYWREPIVLIQNREKQPLSGR